jgi:hypothetical protein
LAGFLAAALTFPLGLALAVFFADFFAGEAFVAFIFVFDFDFDFFALALAMWPP